MSSSRETAPAGMQPKAMQGPARATGSGTRGNLKGAASAPWWTCTTKPRHARLLVLRFLRFVILAERAVTEVLPMKAAQTARLHLDTDGNLAGSSAGRPWLEPKPGGNLPGVAQHIDGPQFAAVRSVSW
ncbi:hypothetical protein [uncultured Thiodictyon sp.]|uniref:hypothetical protein n=1 Tax=uncultured Thiodictyon sp. TaxID=1846217 RepID=UPI0025E52D37|nr:hypothetical protein [uncultured Thiodictyon sp.]